MNILILGAGAWGTALAINAAQNTPTSQQASHQVTLWSRDTAQAHNMQTQRCNAAYLPTVPFPLALQIASGAITPLLGKLDLCIIATPMSALREMLLQVQDVTCPVVWLCKGFEAAQNSNIGLLGHEVAAQICKPSMQTGILSGPSFALEVARAQPTALVAASEHPQVTATLVKAFHSSHTQLRIYTSSDVVGVEVGGAVKNVLAIATGWCDGMGLGLNARAALLTRGLAEMTRLGLALGAKPETFMGLSGMGDLILTATGELSRNRKVGMLLAKGYSLPEALASLGHVAEGVYSAQTVLQRAVSLNVDMPITQSVVRVLNNEITAQEALAFLMGREAKHEL